MGDGYPSSMVSFMPLSKLSSIFDVSLISVVLISLSSCSTAFKFKETGSSLVGYGLDLTSSAAVLSTSDLFFFALF